VTPERREQVFESLTHVGEAWSGARVRQGRLAMRRKRAQRRALRGGGAALGAMAALLLAFTHASPSPSVATTRAKEPAEPVVDDLADGALLLADGSSAEPLRAETALAVAEDGADRVQIDLLDGAARFDVVPDPRRVFSVDARGVRIDVLGTSFDVSIDERRVFVRVLRGHVRVTWRRGRRDLLADQSGIFPIDDVAWAGAAADAPPDEAAASVDEARTTAPEAPGEGARELSPRAAPREDWRGLARRGDYESAYRASREQDVGTTIEDLLLAADAARLSGHPREALPYLERAVALHARDARAHLAAFTLGRVHLQLGDASEAARAFAEAQRLDRRGLLVEQALAREVEAWSRAGRADLARARARSYIQRFPDGRYADRVRRFATPP
jgi:transmembrane sensor